MFKCVLIRQSISMISEKKGVITKDRNFTFRTSVIFVTCALISVVGATNKLDKNEEPPVLGVGVSLVDVIGVGLDCSFFKINSPFGVVAVDEEDESIFCTWTGVGPYAPVAEEDADETRPIVVLIAVCCVFVEETVE